MRHDLGVGEAGMYTFNHRGARLAPEPEPEPEPEVRHVVSVCMWCDFGQHPYSDRDPESVSMTVPIPKLENGVKVGIAYTIEEHRCGPCGKVQQEAAEKRQAIAAGRADAEVKLANAIDATWSNPL